MRIGLIGISRVGIVSGAASLAPPRHLAEKDGWKIIEFISGPRRQRPLPKKRPASAQTISAMDIYMTRSATGCPVAGDCRQIACRNSRIEPRQERRSP